MKTLLIFVGILFLVSMTFVSAIDSISCVPVTVAQGGTIECEIDLANGNSEKNQAYNITFYNESAQSTVIAGCTFAGTTENKKNPIDIIQGCTIPGAWGATNNSVVNFSLTSLVTDDTFIFNISETSSALLIISGFSFDTIFLGKQTGAKWIVSKQDTGKAVVGASCNGDILELVNGSLVPIGGTTSGFQSLTSKYGGHTLVSFTPTVSSLDEGRSYIVEVRCDCVPENSGCMDEDGVVLINSSQVSGLFGIGTSSISISTWLTVNTVTDQTGYEVGETAVVCANITNPENRSRQAVSIEYNLRCDSGSDSDTNRILLGDHVELRGISGNTTQMQCHDFKIPDIEELEKGATTCYGATDVMVLDGLSNPLVTYNTLSSAFTITTDRIHPEIFWERISRNVYFANVSFINFDVGIKEVHATINQLIHAPDSHATSIKSFTVKYMNGTTVPFTTRISAHERFIRSIGSDESVRDFDIISIAIIDVNTSLDDFFNVTIEFIDTDNRTSSALEGIDDKTGTFAFSIDTPTTIAFGTSIPVKLSSQVELGSLSEVEGHFICYIDGFRTETETQWTHAVNSSTPYITTILLSSQNVVDEYDNVICKLGESSFGNLIATATASVKVAPKTYGSSVMVGDVEVGCEPKWECSSYGDCVNGTKTRTCEITNGCNVEIDRPEEEKSCGDIIKIIKSKTFLILAMVGAILLVCSLMWISRDKKEKEKY